MPTEWREQQSRLHDAIQRDAGPSDVLAAGSVLTGWVCVAEFMDPQGNKWLALRSGPMELTAWAREGYLHNALFSTAWELDREDEDD